MKEKLGTSAETIFDIYLFIVSINIWHHVSFFGFNFPICIVFHLNKYVGLEQKKTIGKIGF